MQTRLLQKRRIKKAVILTGYRVDNKKVFHKSEEKMQKELKMILQRAKNLVHVKQHSGISFCKKIFFVY